MTDTTGPHVHLALIYDFGDTRLSNLHLVTQRSLLTKCTKWACMTCSRRMRTGTEAGTREQCGTGDVSEAGQDAPGSKCGHDGVAGSNHLTCLVEYRQDELEGLQDAVDCISVDKHDVEMQAAEQAETYHQLTDVNNTLMLAEEAVSEENSIYDIFSDDFDFFCLVKLINFSDDVADVLKDTSTNITFFAPLNQALRPPHHRSEYSLDFSEFPALIPSDLFHDLVHAMQAVEKLNHTEQLDDDDDHKKH
ncbi:hypothetical protein EW146_g6321 [Bondarzewia mesenterica]|uniref:FAS1 domain-containing protein n=1 Tax=Bondarzewia mesenterica TaxID=1095465 RepID=A0A4S4LUL0_9AGAM|nr:hypothetical protein EW146_g6321 [Bondarzewia mesenterica]